MLERHVEARICEYAKAIGAIPYKFTSPARRGVPDRLFVLRGGRVVFMEIKRAGEKPTALQEREMELLRSQGAIVSWFDDAEKACRWLGSL